MNPDRPRPSDDAAAPAEATPATTPWTWAVLGAGIVAAFGFEGIARWFGVAAILAVLPDLARGRLPPAARERLARWAPALLVVLATFVLLDPLWRGIPPASRDHGIHYYQVHLLVHELLPRGRLTGWVADYNNGYPFGESYPVLGYLWCAAPHLLSFGVIGLRASYALGLFGLWALAIFASWRVGFVVAREVTSSASAARWIAAVGALLWLLDPGGSRLGGWSYMMFHGVWAQLMSSALWLLALTLQWQAWRAPTPRRLALATFVLAGSVLAHPFGMLTAAVSGTAWIGVLVWAPGTSKLPAGRARSWLVMHLGAAAMAAGWLTTFFGAADSMRRGPVAWEPLAELAAGFVRGDLFVGHWLWAGPAAVVGAILLVRRGGAMAWVVLASLAMILVLASTEAITLLRLDLLVAGFKNLQFPRWSIALKPLWFALGGVGIVGATRALAAWSSPRAQRAGLGARFAAALLAAPLVASLAAEPSRLVARPIGGIDTLADAGLEQAELDLLRALRAERAVTGEDMRVAFLRRGMTGAMWPLFPLAEARLPIVLDGHVATINFRHRVMYRKPAVLAALGVTHILYDGHLGNDETLAAASHTIGEYGHAKLARLSAPPDLVPVELTGRGTLQIDAQTAETLTFDVQGTAQDSRLFLHVPPHDKWHLTRDGETVEVDHWGSAYVRSRVVEPADGHYELRYADTRRQVRAFWLSVVVAIGGLVALAFGRPLSGRAIAIPPTLRRLAPIVAAVLLAGGLWWIDRHQRAQLAETWNEIGELTRRGRTPARTFVRDLVDDDRIEVTRTPERACVGVMTKNALADCVEVDRAPRRQLLYDEPYLYRCLQVSVPPRGEVRFSFPGVDASQLVLGSLQHLGDPRQELRYRFSGAARPLRRNAERIDLDGVALAEGAALVVTNRHRIPQPVCLAAALFARE